MWCGCFGCLQIFEAAEVIDWIDDGESPLCPHCGMDAVMAGVTEYPDMFAAGADLYLTGEISEPQAHYARETGVAYVAAGHHATERYGVQALGRHLSGRFGLTCTFIDIDNPA